MYDKNVLGVLRIGKLGFRTLADPVNMTQLTYFSVYLRIRAVNLWTSYTTHSLHLQMKTRNL